MRILTLLLCSPALAQHPLPLLYVTDSGNDQVHRLNDANGDGDYEDPGEVTVFYDDTLGPFELGNNNGIAVDARGIVYVCDSSSDFVLALEDLDGDGTCHGPGEARIFYSDANLEGIPFGSPSDMTFDGNRLWVAIPGAGNEPDIIMWMEDLDGDGNALARTIHEGLPRSS